MTLSLGSIPSLAFSVAGNLFLAGIFANALLNPLANADFIFKTGLLIFLVEFISVHSSAMLAGGQKIASKIVIVGVYSIFILAFALIFSNIYVLALFSISLVAKLLGAKSAPETQALRRAGLSIALFVFTTFAVVLLAPLLAAVFPFPQEVFAAKLVNVSGLLVDVPQTLVFWGVLYYSLAAVVEMVLFLRGKHFKLKLR